MGRRDTQRFCHSPYFGGWRRHDGEYHGALVKGSAFLVLGSWFSVLGSERRTQNAEPGTQALRSTGLGANPLLACTCESESSEFHDVAKKVFLKDTEQKLSL